MPDFKPLLAVEADIDKLSFPRWVSPKLDGIRCIVIDGVGYSRSMKPIRNEFVQAMLGPEYNNLDGELIVGDPAAKDCYSVTNSGVMSIKGEPDFKFHVFDTIGDERPFGERFMSLSSRLGRLDRAVMVSHVHVGTAELLREIEEEFLDQGFEGLMSRCPKGRYKQGRSTLKEGILLKHKRFVDEEFEVIGFQQFMHNGNEATKDELGHTKRSTAKDGLVPVDTLGALILKHPLGQFGVGTGFTAKQRQEIWDNRENLLGAMAKIKHFPIGVKDFPRFPVFLGFRDKDDM